VNTTLYGLISEHKLHFMAVLVVLLVLAFTLTDKTLKTYTEQQIVLSVIFLILTLNMLSHQDVSTKKLMFIISSQCFFVCLCSFLYADHANS